ncbi:NAD(P)H-hydrate dehydratase [Planctomicrobium piriforme]|uniref:ADP-dependent (S)-NAD(P)H-hydrate dehydratase n=1 Tax=Planctomicrobium piriforme TaxID=1576369 RepID=A0A1I3LY24_9PLAN|nr:NAD(P)H-hydrate dehydratase [Planctomicrobium piriforme]SFI89622.1 NAD(P)H-hydrate epimerase [Planctomicrobium piriforme]
MTLQRVTTIAKPPRRPAESHKGTFGRVLIVAGSPGMSGAAALAGLGALRGGAGLVYIATPKSLLPIVGAIEPSYLTLPLSDGDDGQLATSALAEIEAAMEGKNACGIGPGLGASPSVQKVVTTLYRTAKLPMLFDADALNCLSKEREILSSPGGPRILTPHPGEFARLIDSDIKTVQANREKLAIEFAAENKVVLVLKGHATVVTDGERVYTNTTGNSGMATGGTGDVLTGLTTALLAQQMPTFEAAQLAVFLHGRAGDLAAEELSEPGLIASDLARFLGKAWLSL